MGPIGNTVEFILEDDPLPKHEKHSFAVFMSNPGISPPPHENIWKFETLSDGKRVDCNFDVPGFKIYGDFSQSEIAGAILAPGVHNIIGIWFKLATDLEYTSESYMRIWMPKGYEVENDCGFDDFKLEYTRIPNAKEAFPDTVKFVPLPSGSSCEAELDPESGQFYVLLKIDAMLEFGVDYAFQFGVTNPEKQPLPKDNNFRFETLVNGVILHLRRDIRGFQLGRLKVFNIEPFDTTSQLPMAKLQLTLVSDKNIPGGSQISVYAPRGFVFTCAYFRTQVLASTTTCYTKQNLARFTVDSQDPKPPNVQLGITVYATNPQFTPQPNFWGCDVISPLGSFVDTISEHQGYDITGAIIASVNGSFKYYGQRSRLSVQFIPSTIMNQADIGNEIVIYAPENYRFPRNCTHFSFRFSNQEQIDQRHPNADQYNFPPEPLIVLGTIICEIRILSCGCRTGLGCWPRTTTRSRWRSSTPRLTQMRTTLPTRLGKSLRGCPIRRSTGRSMPTGASNRTIIIFRSWLWSRTISALLRLVSSLRPCSSSTDHFPPEAQSASISLPVAIGFGDGARGLS